MQVSENPFKKIDKKTRNKIIIIAAVILVIVGYVLWDVLAGGPLTTLLSNSDLIVEWVGSHGILAPIAFVFLQILQTILAPIPGNVVGGVGGYLFGWWGILWTVIGVAIGGMLVFLISRKLGRPIVEKVVKADNLKKFDFIAGKNAPFILFMIFLLPGLPDDIVCYIAGLTDVPIWKLVLILVIGRLPTIVATNYIGAGLEAAEIGPVIAVSVGAVIVLALAVWQKDRILGFLKGRGGKE